jgi:AAA+ ATPase superfamily predicted ATPase
MKFLELRFNEVGMQLPKSVLEEVVRTLDGIPGWLAFYGYKAYQSRRFDVLNEVLEKAVQLALGELEKIARSSRFYGTYREP